MSGVAPRSAESVDPSGSVASATRSESSDGPGAGVAAPSGDEPSPSGERDVDAASALAGLEYRITCRADVADRVLQAEWDAAVEAVRGCLRPEPTLPSVAACVAARPMLRPEKLNPRSFGQADPLPRAHCAFHNCAWTPSDTRSEQSVEKARASHLLSAPHPTAAGVDSGRTHLLAAIEVLSRMRAPPPGADQDPEAGVTVGEDPEPVVTRAPGDLRLTRREEGVLAVYGAAVAEQR